jgi:hypothetical protein
MKKLLQALLLVLPFASSFAVQPLTNGQCESGEPMFTKQIAEQLINQWNDSLKTESPALVARNYGPQAVLLPTKSPVVKTTPNLLLGYFNKFLQLKPRITKLYDTTLYSSCGIGVTNGNYDFGVTVNGKPQTVKTRYTFVYEYLSHPTDGRPAGWYIVTHHSSVQPKGM